MARVYQAEYSACDSKEFAIDILADVLHWCRANRLDPEVIWHTAEIHYHEERRQELASDGE
jgi:hypothetical protein